MDRKQEIVDALDTMRKKEIADKQPFKARAYTNVLKQINLITTPITTFDDLKNVNGIGDSIKKKILEVLDTGRLKQADEFQLHPKALLLDSLLKVHGIGPAKANDLIKVPYIKSIEDLRKHQNDLLNEKQKLGLKYYEEFQLRIPRKEMEQHKSIVTTVVGNIDDRYAVEITGSFRRGEKTSGDIDVLITHPDDTLDHESNFRNIIESCAGMKYVKDIFAQGTKKCLAVCKANRYRHYRRIDFMMTHKNEFPFALLYFTGSGAFNVAMRNLAIQKGYSLSEYGLKHLQGPNKDKFITQVFENEEDIFKFLEIKYIPPHERISNVIFEEL